MKRLLLVFLILGYGNLAAQKQLRKTILNDRTTSVIINSENCYQISLETIKGTELRVEAAIEGEYSKDLVIKLEEQGTSILVSAGFQPGFLFPNDKLSAHKVISISLHIHIPEFKQVKVYGTNTNVQAKGNYSDLSITLDDGECRITNVGENVDVVTQKGNIWLNAISGIVQANSAYGQVFPSPIPTGDNRYVLNTKEGNIYLSNTK
ncbi:hypothetical protein [Flagellimonas allohymeniacidonis]|uniref:Adhesin domain-containing protein n=1 Tax=Flagellimonas allohymeniacidonis TaxID=2517819 RepID=A0A4Q8QGQ8_9FLAO|nr:hypothetical protein [Allomuricauda hymeniacidonis]TAI47783.1 hypothetical protein EW142_14085 [Allomuricauda hymeniacidonis]